MKKHYLVGARRTAVFSSVAIVGAFLVIGAGSWSARRTPIHMPYKAAGLTKIQAAAHLLNRFAFGPMPGEVARVAEMGPEKWFEDQLNETDQSPRLDRILDHFDALKMSNAEILATFPLQGRLIREAVKEEIIPKDYKSIDKKDLRSELMPWMKGKGYRPFRQLTGQLLAQKYFRAIYDPNQLSEVLTDFWFNHFTVSLVNNQARSFILTYERDAIRPHVLGHFHDLLEATAKNPAMLLYLNNAESTAPDSVVTTMETDMDKFADSHPAMRYAVQRRMNAYQKRRIEQQSKQKVKGGINENYAREVMELHTLGVDGGYTQQDVEQVARALTGWSIFPMNNPRQAQNLERRMSRLGRAGFVRQGDFLFRADVHDAGVKVILGKRFPAGHGLDEGERVLDMLAESPSTARHISYELAVHFVSDNPPESLIDRMTDTYIKTHGDIKALLTTIVESPEFWSPAEMQAKIKNPFEYVISSVRAVGARVTNPRQLVEWTTKIGEKMYACQAPAGYGDKASDWVSAGALLSRMNFGMKLASGQIKGVSVDLMALNMAMNRSRQRRL